MASNLAMSCRTQADPLIHSSTPCCTNNIVPQVRVRAHRSCWLLDAAVLLVMYGTLLSSTGMECLQLWEYANSGGQAPVWPGSSSATSGFGGGQGSGCGSNVAFEAPSTVGAARVHILAHSQGRWLYAAAGSAVVVGCSAVLATLMDLAWRLAFMASSRRKAGRSAGATPPLTDATASLAPAGAQL